MERIKRINRNLVFALQVLLLFLLVFEGQWEAPAWLQAGGRMHPLLLHLPIGLLLLLGVMPLLRKEVPAEALHRMRSLVLHLGALTAVLTSLAGLWLAQEEGYSSDLVTRHKWLGAAVSLGTYLLLLWHEQRPRRQPLFYGALLLNLGLLTVAGHLGASLTHGEDFVLAPLRTPAAAPVVTDSTPVFTAAIRPVLDAKCFACHNERKTKGGLLMSTEAGLLAGGENGPLWVPGDLANSHLVQRINLPLEEEEHMPPEGKAQLTNAEISLLEAWIAAGADMTQTLGELPPETELAMRVEQQLGSGKAAAQSYDFAAADPELIQELNTPFRTLRPVALGSPALQAEIFVRNYYEPGFLQALEAVKAQLVSLNLTNLPITDADLKLIGQFTQLEKLTLNGTDLTGETLGELARCQQLRSLALSNTAVTPGSLLALQELPKLEELYLWNTAVDSAALAGLEKQLAGVKFYTGYVPEAGEILPLSPPRLKNKEPILAEGQGARLENKLPGVEIRYTLDGSEPDSLTSPVYEGPIFIAEPTPLKARCFKPGWLSSETAEYVLFPAGLAVDTAWLVHPPMAKYPGKGALALVDGIKGRMEPKLGDLWMGFAQAPMDLTLDLGQAQPVTAVALSYLERMKNWQVWPAWVEVWGGDSPETLQRLGRVAPETPREYGPRRIAAVTVPLDQPGRYRYLKVVAQPVQRLPAWHQGAGKLGNLLVDEVLVYGGEGI